MGGVNVKITMIERVLQIVAPHPCCGCGKLGAILCDDCKYDIIHEPFVGCILCGTPQKTGICIKHTSPIERAFVVGSRKGALEDTINRLKFSNSKQAAKPLAMLLHETLPILPASICLVPIPTVTSHIRQRGYDHVDLIIRHFVGFRNLRVDRLLRRITSDTQHTAGRTERHQQAACAFSLRSEEALEGKIILLVDDIITTGATLQAAAKVLQSAGATVWVATLAYQPLD